MAAKPSQTDTLRTYVGILKRRWLPATAVCLAIAGLGVFVVSRWQQPTYVAEGQLRFTKVNPISKLTDLGTEVGNLDPLDAKGKALNTEAAVIRSIPVLQQTLDQLGWPQAPGLAGTPKAFRSKLSISEVQGADILRLTYQARDPEAAANAINTLMAVYLEKHLQDNRTEVEQASQFIAKQLPASEQAVKQAEADLREFKQQNLIVNLSNREVDAEAKITALQNQISDATTSLAKVQSEADLLRSKLGMTSEEALKAVSLSQSPEVQAILTQLRETEAQLALQKNQLTTTHPTVTALERDVNQLRDLLQQRVQQQFGGALPTRPVRPAGGLQQTLTADLVRLEVTRKGLVSQIKTLSLTLDNYQQQLQLLPALAEQMRQLERKVEATQSTYTQLLRKQQEVRAETNQNAGNARIMVRAEPPETPVSEGESAYMAAALLGGLAFLGTVYILEALDKTLRTVEDILHTFDYPLLGVLPTFKSARSQLFYDGDLEQVVPQIYLRDFPSSPISEAYRLLQVRLKSLRGRSQYRTLVVTSSVPQEGKSTVVANLATALGQAGRQVLIIDANLRNPFQDLIWDVSNEVGLSNLLFGQAPFTTAVESVTTHVDVLTAGSRLNHAGNVLESQQMALLLKSIRSSYDTILIDAPSLNTSADVAVLSGMAEGVIVVAKPGLLTQPDAEKAKEWLLGTGQRVLGLIVNGAWRGDQRSTRYLFEPGYEESAEIVYPDLPVTPEMFEVPQTTITVLPDLPKIQLLADHDSQDLEQIPLKALQNHVEHLQQRWMRSAHFVHEQEEELLLVSQTVDQFQNELRLAQDDEGPMAASHLIMLEVQLADHLEQQKLLEATLVGQRQRLQRQKMLFQQYSEILKQRTRLRLKAAGQPLDAMLDDGLL